MSNGPLGGNMGTPPVAPQPPQVSFTTTAESRGGFNNFLKSIPSTTAMTPLPPMGSPQMPPMGGNPMGNIDIFNQPPSMGMGMMGMNQPQMNPMMQPPMNMGVGLMGTPVQNFYNGGYADSDFGGFSDYGSVDATSDDGFSEDNDVSDYSTDDSGVYTGGDDNNQDIPLPTPRPDILQEAVSRAETDIFGGSSSDDLRYFNDDGQTLSNTGKEAYNESIMANLDALQNPEQFKDTSDGSTQLATLGNIFDGVKSGATPENLVQASFRPNSLNPTFSGNVLDGLDLNAAFGQNRTATNQNKSFVESQPEGALKNTIFDYVPDAFQISNFLSQRGNQAPTGIAPVGTQGSGSRGDTIQSIPQVDSFGDPARVDPNVMTESAIKTGTGNIAGMDENTFRSLSSDAQQQILNDIRAADLGTTFTNIDSQPNFGIAPDTALETMAGRIGPVDTVFDIDTTDTRNFVGDDFQSALDLIDRRQELATRDAMNQDFDKIDRAEDPSTVGDDAFDDSTFIETPPNMVEAGVPSIEAPKEFRDPFTNAGIGAIPTLTSLANKFSAYSRGRVLDSIAQKGYTPVMDGDVIVGAKNELGQLMEGMDPNAPMGSDDNNENPFILKSKPQEEEKEEEDKPPNVIGGGETPAPVSSGSVVVDSPFTSNVGNFIPSSFNTGELNKLIAALTGVSAPRAMKQGGVAGYAEGGRVMQALDNFLATG